ncbi:hypothetical protein QYF36_000377 [Acer negundo]|nr:hypothetical protein QYF36_000377 [Acer negundo]
MANKSTSIYKIFWFISCCLWASHVAAVDVLNQGDVLNSSASLVSRNGRFYLRFYNLSSMSDFMSSYSYLGIFYAPGSFSLDWDPDEHQLILRRRGVTFWTSGVLLENSSKFENIALDAKEADHKFIEVSNEEGKYLTYEFLPNQYTPANWINVTWLWLNFDGVMGDQSSNRGVLLSDLCDGNRVSSGCLLLTVLDANFGMDLLIKNLLLGEREEDLGVDFNCCSSNIGCNTLRYFGLYEMEKTSTTTEVPIGVDDIR